MVSVSSTIFDLEFPADRFRPSPGAVANWFSHRLDTIWIGAGKEDAGKASAHEFAHFVLHAVTPYGVFLDQLAQLQRNLLLQYCVKVHSNLKERIRYPIYDFAKRFDDPQFVSQLGLPHPEKYKEFISSYIQPWSQTAFLENILEGEFLPSVSAATEGKAIQALEMAEGKMAELYLDENLFRGRQVPPIRTGRVRFAMEHLPGAAQFPDLLEDTALKACPTVKIPSYSAVIGARSIFEGHAFVAQVGYDSETMQKLMLSDPSLRYMAVYLMTVQKFGPKRINSLETYRQLKRTLNALCDVALFTPIGPVYSRLRPHSFTWLDVHPGYRFTKALNHVAEQDGWLDSPKQEDYAVFQNNLCEALDWPSPEQFVNLGTSLTLKDLARHRKACLIRKDFPNLFMEDEHQSGEFGLRMKSLILEDFPLLFMPSAREFTVAPRDGIHTAAGKVIRYFLETFLWEIMTSKNVRLLDCLPENLDYPKFVANIQNDQEMLDMIVNAQPYIGALEPLAL